MDVSNSTGQGTGYRVVGAGGNKPDPKKFKDGEIVEISKKKHIKLKDKLWEILAEDTLEPWTYVSLQINKSPVMVQFHRNNVSIWVCDNIDTQPADLLIALTENGKSAAKGGCVCRKKKA